MEYCRTHLQTQLPLPDRLHINHILGEKYFLLALRKCFTLAQPTICFARLDVMHTSAYIDYSWQRTLFLSKLEQRLELIHEYPFTTGYSECVKQLGGLLKTTNGLDEWNQQFYYEAFCTTSLFEKVIIHFKHNKSLHNVYIEYDQ